MAWKELSQTVASGEVFNAKHFFSDGKIGWYVNKNGNSTVFIPYSSSIEISGSRYTATTIEQALHTGKLLIKAIENAEIEFEKSHPELNP